MIEGNRVHVNGGGLQGLATVMHFFPNELYSVQVELDEADENGHRVHRFAADEVKQVAQTKPQELNGKHYARVSKKYSWFTVGDEYIIGPANTAQYYNVYALNGLILGAYSENFFDVIRPCEETEKPQVIKPHLKPVFEAKASGGVFIKTEPIKPQDEPKTVEITPMELKPLDANQQLSIFDFM